MNNAMSGLTQVLPAFFQLRGYRQARGLAAAGFRRGGNQAETIDLAGGKPETPRVAGVSGPTRSPLFPRLSLYFFLPLAALIIGGAVFIHRIETERTAAYIHLHEDREVGRGAEALVGKLDVIGRNVLYLSRHDALLDSIDDPSPRNLAHLARDFSNLSASKAVYDQIRWLDETGMEILRIDNVNGKAVVVPKEKLQDKSGRYFFTDAIKLERGEIYISPLDLNIEHDKVEVPHKPMIRVGTPVFGRDGNKRGIVLINYSAKDMLDAFGRAAAGIADHVVILNREGFWLRSTDAADEWGFMLNRKETFGDRYPAAWARIQAENSGQFETGEGLWTFETIHPLLAGQRTGSGAGAAFAPGGRELESHQYYWKVVSRLPPGVLSAMRCEADAALAAAAVLLLALSLAGSWKLGQAWLELTTATAALKAEIGWRRRVEQSLEENNAQLVEAQRIAHLGRWEIDVRSCSHHWSAEVFRILEVDPGIAEAGIDTFMAVVHPEDREMVRRAYADYVKNGAAYDLTHRLLMPGGRIKFVHERGEIRHGANGDPFRAVGTIQDVTELEQARRNLAGLSADLERRVAGRTAELKAVNAELKAVNAELETFSYSVSHDLRAPLRAIDGYSRMIVEQCTDRLTVEERRLFDRVLANVQRMDQLIHDLLNLARVSHTVLKRQDVNLSELAAEVVQTLRERYPDRQRNVETVIAPNMHANGDAGLLRDVLENLLGNAWKYSGKRDAAKIEFGSYPGNDGENICFIRDNGAGFDMKYADKLFGAFQRLHSPSEFDGTGVGLASVKRIIERHDGRIWAEAKVGHGATFHFKL